MRPHTKLQSEISKLRKYFIEVQLFSATVSLVFANSRNLHFTTRDPLISLLRLCSRLYRQC